MELEKVEDKNGGKRGQTGAEFCLPLTLKRMPGESSRQYASWLLYYRFGSLRKLLEVWDKVPEIEAIAEFAPKIGKKPGQTTIETWSKKYNWVERYDLQYKQFLEEMSLETNRIVMGRKDKIAQIFKVASDKKLRQLNAGEIVSDSLYKNSWEMLMAELGLSTSTINHNIREEDQRPPTPEELKFDKFIGEQSIKYLGTDNAEPQSREQHNLLDS